ncbi:MAG TPA: hypothetical protein VMZ28_31585 [Kofleriaceae bacterium]|nr:hypothetical protein [Kofleriaceae bacterium]
MRRRLVAAVIAGVALGGAAALARAGESAAIARARGHIAAVEYDLAQAALDEALRGGGNGPVETAEIHGLLALVAASRGQAAEAQAAFERQLAIAPAATVDRELGPKIVEPFAAAQAALRGRAIAVEARAIEGGVELVVAGDPLAMVVAARVSGRAGALTDAAVSGGRAALVLARGVGGTVVVSALDAHGNRLAEVEVPLPQARVAAATTTEVAPARRSRRWMLWAGGAAGFLATGTVFALMARSTRSELDDVVEDSGDHTLEEARALDDTGRRRTLIANLSFGAAGVLAAVAAADYLWWSEERPARLTVAPAPSGWTVGLAGRF